MVEGRSANGWTVDTAVAHFDRIIEDMDRRIETQFTEKDKALNAALAAAEKAVNAALAAADRAVQKAESASDKRFEAVNEFRAALQDMTSRLMTRDEVEAKMATATKDISNLEKRITNTEGHSTGIKDSWGYIVAVVSVGLLAAEIFFRHGG